MSDIQQLVKKNTLGETYNNIFPKTFFDAITDKETGTSLKERLAMFNMLFLSYVGSKSSTRTQVPLSFRREGLWVTYVMYDKTVVTEWYTGEAVDNTSWGNDSNWRNGSNSLVGDITISSTGYWVINGVISEIKAQGEAGITPILRVDSNNHLQVSYTNGSSWVDVSTNPVYTQFRINNNKLEQSVDLGQTWTVVSDYIASWFRFTGTTGSSQADNVGKIQISRDNGVTWADLSGEFTNSLHIKGYVATVGTLPSNAVQGDIYGVGPTYDPSDTEQTNPIYQLYVKDSTGWINNGRFTSIAAGVVQTTGTSTTEVMSQKAVTDELDAKADHGYMSNPKTLKQVEDSLVQFVNLKEAAANKQDSLAVDGHGVKFPTVDAVNLGLATKPAKTNQIVAGLGLTGGGTLEADRTLNVVSANDGITVNADNIQLNVVDGLEGTSATQPLSAKQGKALNTKIETKVSELLAATVYISDNDYQMLIDNNLVEPNVEYNIYEE